jgi:hypothetical protein
MNQLREAAQQALEALDQVTRHFTRIPSTLADSEKRGLAHQAIDALRAALAQPEQEPVLHKWAALFEDPNNDWQAGYESARRWVLEVGLQSIAAPPQRKPLTDELIDVLASAMVKGDKSVNWLCRVIEAEHGIGVGE